MWKAEVVKNNSTNTEPGKILKFSNRSIIVKAGEDSINLLEIEPKVKFNEGGYL